MGRDFISFTENIKEKAEVKWKLTGRLVLNITVLNFIINALASTKFAKESRNCCY